jgi:hypothetical protein
LRTAADNAAMAPHHAGYGSPMTIPPSIEVNVPVW